jgi:hypothetical protein
MRGQLDPCFKKRGGGGHNFDVIRGKGKMVKFILDQDKKAQKGAEV